MKEEKIKIEVEGTEEKIITKDGEFIISLSSPCIKEGEDNTTIEAEIGVKPPENFINKQELFDPGFYFEHVLGFDPEDHPDPELKKIILRRDYIVKKYTIFVVLPFFNRTEKFEFYLVDEEKINKIKEELNRMAKKIHDNKIKDEIKSISCLTVYAEGNELQLAGVCSYELKEEIMKKINKFKDYFLKKIEEKKFIVLYKEDILTLFEMEVK